MKQIFLSYARSDGARAKRLYDDLRRIKAVRIWFDRVDLLPGVRWKPAIRKAIRESDYFLAVLSKQAVSNRGFRHSELRDALDVAREFPENWIFVVPTRLDDCPMPFQELEELSFADLFPEWDEGVAMLRRTLETGALVGRTRTLADGSSPAGSEMISLREPTGAAVKIKIGGLADKRKPRRSVAAEESFHYRVGLADLEEGIPTIGRIARGLNSVQSAFRFSPQRLAAPHQALKTIDRNPQLYIPKLPKSFFEQIGPLEMDCVVCLTHRLLAFEEGNSVLYNYLSGPSPSDPRVLFVSYTDLNAHARAAGVTLDVAIAYRITAQLVDYFLDLGYHEETRACPMDFDEDHSDMVGGLRAGRFCRFCSCTLNKSRPFADAFKAMIAWGR
jgi:hypothetical protein